MKDEYGMNKEIEKCLMELEEDLDKIKNKTVGEKDEDGFEFTKEDKLCAIISRLRITYNELTVMKDKISVMKEFAKLSDSPEED